MAHLLDGDEFVPKLSQLKAIVILFSILLNIIMQVYSELALSPLSTYRMSIVGEGKIRGEERGVFIGESETALLGACFLLGGTHHL